MDKFVEGLNFNSDIARITLHGVVDRKGIAAEVFGVLGQHGLNVELISTTSIGRGRADISFAVLEPFADKACKVIEAMKDTFKTKKIAVDKNCALITIFGPMLSSTPGIAGTVFAKLAERGVNIEMISASLSSVSMIVPRDRVTYAVKAIQDEFGK
jgi:aspartate kinase